MEYKRKLSPGNLQHILPKYGHLSHLVEIMEFSSFDVARQQGNHETAQPLSCFLDSQDIDFINTVSIIFNKKYNIYRFGTPLFLPIPWQNVQFSAKLASMSSLVVQRKQLFGCTIQTVINFLTFVAIWWYCVCSAHRCKGTNWLILKDISAFIQELQICLHYVLDDPRIPGYDGNITHCYYYKFKEVDANENLFFRMASLWFFSRKYLLLWHLHCNVSLIFLEYNSDS